MKHTIVLLFLAIMAFTTPARAAYVYDGYDTGPGGFSTPYPAVNPEVYAGFVQINYGGNPVLMMSDDYANRTNATSWSTTLYTYAEVMAGAPGKFTPAQYARAGFLLHSYFPME